MWNYSFVIPEFMILLILLAFYFSRPQISIRINRTFLGILLLQTFVIMFDLIASQADEMYASFPASVLYALNLAYFVLFLARIFWFFLFTADALGVRFYGNRLRQFIAGSVFFIAEAVTLSSPFTGAVFRIGPSGYEKGPWYDIIHVCYLFYIFYAFYFCARFGKNVSRHDLLSIIAALVSLLIGIAARILLPQVIIMNVFCLMAIIIIYLSFMNPDLYDSERGPTFNSRAFRVYTDEEKDRRPFRILGFVLQNYTDEREIYGYDQMDHGITLISEYLNELCPEYTRFYLRYVEPAKSIIDRNAYAFGSLEALDGWESVMGLQFENLVLANLGPLVGMLGLGNAQIVSAAPYRRAASRDGKRPGLQIDLLLQARRTVCLVEIKRRREIGRWIIDEMAAKVAALPRRRGVSVRTALVYEGHVAPIVEADGYFDAIIDIRDVVF